MSVARRARSTASWARTAPGRRRSCGCCSGSSRPDAGTLEVLGRTLASATAPARSTASPGSSRARSSTPYLTGRGEPAAARRPRRAAAPRRRVDEVLDIVDLAGRDRDKVARLLLRHAPAPRGRRVAAARPAAARARRARERPRPGRHPRHAGARQAAGGQRPHGAAQQPRHGRGRGDLRQRHDHAHRQRRLPRHHRHAPRAGPRARPPAAHHRRRPRALASPTGRPGLVRDRARRRARRARAQAAGRRVRRRTRRGRRRAARAEPASETPLESLFFLLTESTPPTRPTCTPTWPEPADDRHHRPRHRHGERDPSPTAGPPGRRPGTLTVLRWELRKLAAQARGRWTLLGCAGRARPRRARAARPAAAAQGHPLRPPHPHAAATPCRCSSSAFAAQWVFPLLTALVAGDIFASEDHHGTWKTVLTRSVSRTQVFWAKTLTALLFAVVACWCCSPPARSRPACSSSARQPLVGLTGQVIPSGTALPLVVASWATALAAAARLHRPRRPAVGADPQPGGRRRRPGRARPRHAARRGPRRHRPAPAPAAHHPVRVLARPAHRDTASTDLVVEGVVVATGWTALCLAVAYASLRRRDITGG